MQQQTPFSNAMLVACPALGASPQQTHHTAMSHHRHHCMVLPAAVGDRDGLQTRAVAGNVIQQARIDEQRRCSVWGIGLGSHKTDFK